MNNVNEGIFRVNKLTKKITGTTEEDANQRLKDFMDKNKNYNPKVKSKRPIRDAVGRFVYDVVYDEKTEQDDKSIAGRVKKVVGGVGKVVDAARDIVGRQDTFVATSLKDIKAKKAELKSKYPNVRFDNPERLRDGRYQVAYEYKKSDEVKQEEPDIKVTPKATDTPDKDKFNNITKQLAKLTAPQLSNLEKIINNQVIKNTLK